MEKWSIVGHWDGGDGTIDALALSHYNAVVDQGLRVHYGENSLEDQRVTSDGIYGAHTRAFNTRCIGVAMCGMFGAQEGAPPPNYGSDYPIKEHQFYLMCKVMAAYCIQKQIPVTPERVLTHAEVQPNLGIRQNGKWDITVLPWNPDIVGHRMVGDHMRELVSGYILEAEPGMAHLCVDAEIRTAKPLLKIGMRGEDVRVLQSDLHDLRYFAGSIDGIFGKRTRAAVLAFQADNDLDTDGVVGPRTHLMMDKAEPRELRAISATSVEKSGTLDDLRKSDRLADLTGLAGAAQAVASVQDKVAEVQVAADGIMGLWQTIQPYWPILVVLALYMAWRGLNSQARRRRIRDAITGANDAR